MKFWHFPGLLAVLIPICGVWFWNWSEKKRWPLVPQAKIFYNGKISPSSRLYRSPTGEFALELREPRKVKPYLLVPVEAKVYYCNPGKFGFGERSASVRHPEEYGIDLGYTAKSDVVPNVKVGKNSMEFTGLEKKRASARLTKAKGDSNYRVAFCFH